MSSTFLDRTLPDPDSTAALAARFALILKPGDVLLLEGHIGAGKTHFARNLVQSLQDVPEDVPSPTFTLIQSYETSKGEVLHADLYRLSGPEELDELGLTDALEAAICLIEWPDRLGTDAPASALTLSFKFGTTLESRKLVVTGDPAIWGHRLKEVQVD